MEEQKKKEERQVEIKVPLWVPMTTRDHVKLKGPPILTFLYLPLSKAPLPTDAPTTRRMRESILKYIYEYR